MISEDVRVGSDYVLFNLSIDDVHPETSKYLGDCGGDKENGKLGYVVDLLGNYPNLKVTLFVTPNWIDRPNVAGFKRLVKKCLKLSIRNTWSGSPFRLDKHVEWCNWLNEYVDRGVFEVGVHGFGIKNGLSRGVRRWLTKVAYRVLLYQS